MSHDYDFGADTAFPDFTVKFNTSQARHFLVDNDHVVRIGIGLDLSQPVHAAVGAGEFIARLGKNKSHRKRHRPGVVHGQYLESRAHRAAPGRASLIPAECVGLTKVARGPAAFTYKL